MNKNHPTPQDLLSKAHSFLLAMQTNVRSQRDQAANHPFVANAANILKRAVKLDRAANEMNSLIAQLAVVADRASGMPVSQQRAMGERFINEQSLRVVTLVVQADQEGNSEKGKQALAIAHAVSLLASV